MLLLLTDNPSQVLPTIASRCQPVRFDPLPAAELAKRLEARGVAGRAATACARLSLGDGERALAMALEPELRTARRGVRPLRRSTTARWQPVRCSSSRARRARARGRRSRPRWPRSSSTCPRRSTSGAPPSSTSAPAGPSAAPPPARSSTPSSSPASGTATSRAWRPGADDLVHHADRLDALREDAALRDRAAWLRAVELVDDTRASLALNVSEALALEALAYRLEGS